MFGVLFLRTETKCRSHCCIRCWTGKKKLLRGHLGNSWKNFFLTVHPSVHRLFSHFISCLSHRKHRPPPKWDGPKPSRGCRPLRGWALGSAVQSSLSGPDVVPSDQWPWPTGQAVCPLHSLHFSGVGAGYPKLKFPFGKGRVEEAVLAHGNFRLSQLDLIWPLETLLYVSLFLACKNSMLKRMLSLEAPQLQILIPPGASLEAWDCFTI